MSWGSEQIYEVTQIRTLLNPSLDIKSFFFLFFLGGVWLVLADRSLVTWQDLLPVTSRLFLLLAPNSLCAPRFKQWTSFIQMVASECGFLHLWPVHSAALDHHVRFCNALWGSDTALTNTHHWALTSFKVADGTVGQVREFVNTCHLYALGPLPVSHRFWNTRVFYELLR